ncbi:PKD domain-containing protein, partial [Klebsiella pneumoniae]|uniref:PKD domain-containing protein n=1 Tax=Klebsiella pneumoniae TaxID=573 RepID=UPI00385220B0
FTYAWNFVDASSTPANLNTSSQKNPAHIYKAANVYSVKSVVTTAFGCVDSLIKTLTVNGSVPKADFVFTSNQTICSGDSMRITDNSS